MNFCGDGYAILRMPLRHPTTTFLFRVHDECRNARVLLAKAWQETGTKWQMGLAAENIFPVRCGAVFTPDCCRLGIWLQPVCCNHIPSLLPVKRMRWLNN
jgi:hypothetical protein